MSFQKNLLLKKDIAVFIPCKFKTEIIGYWLDNKGKLFKDYIIIQHVNVYQYQRIKARLFSKGEKAVFYVQNDKAYIETMQGTETLTECKAQKIYNPITEKQIFSLCEKFGGFTLFKCSENTWKIEVWQK